MMEEEVGRGHGKVKERGGRRCILQGHDEGLKGSRWWD